MAMIRKTGRKGAAAKFVKARGGNKVRVASTRGSNLGTPTKCNSTRAASNVRAY